MMSNTIFIDKSKRYTIRTVWKVNPIITLIFVNICILSLVIVTLPSFPFSGIRLAVFVIAISVIMSILQMIMSELSKIIVQKLLTKPIETESLSPLSHCFTLTKTKADGYVYFVRRFSDGIYKIGKARDFKKRFRVLCREYGPVYPVAVWEVPNCPSAEKMALEMTSAYHYSENGREELRQMYDEDALNFINEFNQYISTQDVTSNDKIKTVEAHD